ncbi:MAG: hypothetical protein FDW93_04945 [Bergeyella sp.]|nr:hypothetical protein [Bergeyella sp.]
MAGRSEHRSYGLNYKESKYTVRWCSSTIQLGCQPIAGVINTILKKKQRAAAFINYDQPRRNNGENSPARTIDWDKTEKKEKLF